MTARLDHGVTADRGLDWRHQAACVGHDSETWFPIGHSGPALDQIAAAKAVCAVCPVTDQCLTWALATGQEHGIWGGMTTEERAQQPRPERQPIDDLDNEQHGTHAAIKRHYNRGESLCGRCRIEHNERARRTYRERVGRAQAGGAQ